MHFQDLLHSALSPPPTKPETNELYSNYLNDVLAPNDPRSNMEQFAVAKKKELEGLEAHKTWTVIPLGSLSKDANLLGSRFQLTVKNTESKTPTFKARLVVLGHHDGAKLYIVHNSTNLRKHSIKRIIALAAILCFRL